MSHEVRVLPTDQLVPPWAVLRPVNQASIEYLELRDSIAAVGMLNSICVRPSPTQAGRYEIVDGLYRFTVACELRLPTVPAIIKEGLTNEDILAIQIQANAQRPETTPLEYAKQLAKLMRALSAQRGADVGIVEISGLIHKSPNWVSQQLGLLNLVAEAQKAVNRNEIPLASAVALSRIVPSRQSQFIKLAKTMAAKDFVPLAAAWVKQYKEAVRKGKLDDFYADFKPVPYLRSFKEVTAEYKCNNVGASEVVKARCQTAFEGWRLAIQWVLHLDQASVEAQRTKVAERLRTHVLKRSDSEDESLTA